MECRGLHFPLSCGDWGTAITADKFYELLRKVKVIVLSIYGNRENMKVRPQYMNIKTREHFLKDPGNIITKLN